MNISRQPFGKASNGEDAWLYILQNGNTEVSVTNYGCTIVAIKTPDRYGKSENIVLGFDSVEDYQSHQYLQGCQYFGCIIGRVCNRISRGMFHLDGEGYYLAKNDGDRHLHGGLQGFDKKLWHPATIENKKDIGIELSYLSADMEEGYPGNLQTLVRYVLNETGELSIEYFARTDKKTIINLTNHTYFNLTGRRETILNHHLEINSSNIIELNNLIPTGRILDVSGTPYDFRKKTSIGARIDQLPDGYDINYVLEQYDGNCNYACRLSEEQTGRFVEVYTSQPGLQIYSGYYIPEMLFNGRKEFGRYAGFAIETQHYADSVHQPGFPSIVLCPADEYYQKTVCRFGVMN